VITDIKQPVSIKSTISNFFKKYKLPILLWVMLLLIMIAFTFKFNVNLIIAVLVITCILLIALTYYNTYKIAIKNDKLIMNIMFREYVIPKENLLNIYVQRRRSFILLVIPFYYYSINIIYKENEDIKNLKGYSVSTMMLMKEDILKFFKAFSFDKLKK